MNKISYIDAEIEKILNNSKISHKMLRGNQIIDYIECMKSKFVFDDSSTIQIYNSLGFAGHGNYYFIRNILNGNETYLFTKTKNRTVIFIVDGKYVPFIIDEMFGFEYYISDAEANYLMAENFHDIFMFVGEHEKLKNYFLKMRNLQQDTSKNR